MSTLPDTDAILDELLDLLRATPQGELPLEKIRCVEETAYRLAMAEPCWIGTLEARALLGLSKEEYVAYWAKIGLLLSRVTASGTLEVQLGQVLYRRAEREGLLAFGGDDLAPEELRSMNAARPGKYPWQTDGAESST